MPLINIDNDALSNLVFHEVDPASGYARRVITIDDNDAEIPMGTVVYRSATGKPNAAYSVASASDLHTTGTPADVELGVVFGDKYGCKAVFTTPESGDTEVVAFVRGEVQLKDYLLMEALEITDRNSDVYRALKYLLEKQGVILETTLGYDGYVAP